MSEQEKTEFQVRVVRVGAVAKHPNADTLSITDVGGYPVVIRTGDFQPGDEAVYCSVDAVVPTRKPEFAFLARGDLNKTHHRIRATKLRGTFSMGLLVPKSVLGPAASGCEVGDGVADIVGATRYVNPREDPDTGQRVTGRRLRPFGPLLPTYGLDPLRRYASSLQYGEQVVVTEKLHGANARFIYWGGRLWVGSHNSIRGSSRTRLGEFFHRLFRRRDAQPKDQWMAVAQAYGLREKLARRPGIALYGEIYGPKVQDLPYDASERYTRFRAFDAYDLGAKRWLNGGQFLQFVHEVGLDLVEDTVPVLYQGPWTREVEERWKERADTLHSTLNPDHVMEGIVVKPWVDRSDGRGRVALKYAGRAYLLRDEK